MNSNDKRFDNALGEEYELLKLAYPHYDSFETMIGTVIAEHFKDNPLSSIKTLEIGSGTGITTKFLLECDPRLQIVAVDNEKKMMEQISENLKRWDAVSRVTLIEKEIMDYLKDVPDASFDVVTSGFVLHNIENGTRDKLIAEIYRILKPDGIFVNGDKYSENDPVVRQEIYEKQIARFDVYDSIGRSDYKKEWLEHMARDEESDLLFIEGKAKEFMISLGFKHVATNYREMMEAILSGVK
jgi:tRNA (cmo5U34)-methyltransferase